MLTAIFVTHYLPTDVGHGGNHRAYQILHDLREGFGPENVVLVSLPEWQQAAEELARSVTSRHAIDPKMGWIQWAWRLARGLAGRGRRVLRRTIGRIFLLYFQQSPASLVDNEYRLGPGHTTPFVHYYRAVLQQMPQPAVCFIQHVGMTGCIRLNLANGIPTVSCADNIESLDARLPDPRRLRQVFDTAIDLAHEFVILGQCTERLFISKVETGLIGGLGLPSRLYPYVPQGAVRERMLSIGRRRHAESVEAGLFVLVGTVWHSPTEISFRWFIDQARRHGLPMGIRIAIVGWGTEKLLNEVGNVPGIEFKGPLRQVDLDDLLVRAGGMLVPHRAGFGALTRLPELACARIPIIASSHVTYALDLVPGLIVADDWVDWCASMAHLAAQRPEISPETYLSWEAKQPRPIQNLARQWQQCGPSIVHGIRE